jgi:hypothetical protein
MRCGKYYSDASVSASEVEQTALGVRDLRHQKRAFAVNVIARKNACIGAKAEYLCAESVIELAVFVL